MTNLISLTLESVSYQLPNGRNLFANLSENIDARPTGLVGRNGIGKSVLAEILAGERTPTSGKCLRSGAAYYLPQQISLRAEHTVADLAQVKPIIDALQKIERGNSELTLFETIGERWDIHRQLRQELTINHLSHLHAHTPVTQLSGGESMRVALIGAFLSRADFLILDEPTNHLDRESRQVLIEQLQRWKKGLVVISHDRVLLENMSRIIELSTLGLRSYGGGYSFYLRTKTLERENAIAELERLKTERKREERALHEQTERIEKRQARGKKQARNTNQAKILLGRQKERSEITANKQRIKRDARHEALHTHIQKAARRVEDNARIILYTPVPNQFIAKKIAELDNVVLPFIEGAAKTIDLTVSKSQRIAVTGPNGSGKSTLLRIFAGLISPLSGHCHVPVKTTYLDQHLTMLNRERSIIEQILAVNEEWGESLIRTRLAQLGFDAAHVDLPTRFLSGGAQLKAALVCALYADEPPQLLLLDEPSNHLDITSTEALETMLRQFNGTLMIVSHDEIFLENLRLTHRLMAAPEGWMMEAW